MRLLEKNSKLIYHSKRNVTEDEGIEYFDVPVGIKANPMNLSTDYTRVDNGQIITGMLKFLISRDELRNAIVFNPYGYDHPIDGESSYGLDIVNPYGWVEEYLTRWINGGVSQGDYFYVDTTPPDNYVDYIRGKNADYKVVGIENTPNYIGVILRRIT